MVVEQKVLSPYDMTGILSEKFGKEWRFVADGIKKKNIYSGTINIFHSDTALHINKCSRYLKVHNVTYSKRNLRFIFAQKHTSVK